MKDSARVRPASGRARPFPRIVPLRLRDNLHWCECGGRIVFLDVEADRYFGLPAQAHDPFLALAAGAAGSKEIERLSTLTSRALLVEGRNGQPFQQPAAIESPTRDFLSDAPPKCGVGPIFRALAWEFHAAWQLRTRGFSEAITRAGLRCSSRRPRSATGQEIIQSIAGAVDTIAFVTRSHNRCLVRALATHAACRSRAIHSKLVIGVIAHPFAAHSWVQWEDAVLVGGFEQARLYTPILVLE